MVARLENALITSVRKGGTSAREREQGPRLAPSPRRAPSAVGNRRLDTASQALDVPRNDFKRAGATRGAIARLRDVGDGFESLANAARTVLVSDATAFERDRLQKLRRPLFIVDQSLRVTASAASLGRELVATVQGHR